MSDRTDRSKRLRRRFDRPAATGEPGSDAAGVSSSAGADDGAVDPSDESKTSKTSNPSVSAKTPIESETAHASGGSVKERPSTLMYLPSEVDRDLDLTFDEVNLRYRRAFDEKLEKNRDYYPLVALYGLRTLREWDAEDVREALSELGE